MTPAFSREDCDYIVRRLWPYLDGRVPESDRARVTDHLARCTHCQSHFDFAQAFLEAVHAIAPHQEDTEALRKRVLDALAAEGFAA